MTEDFRRRYERDLWVFVSLLCFVLGFRVQTAAPEAEAAAEGIDGAENNNRDERPGAPRFHLFVYRVSGRLLN